MHIAFSALLAQRRYGMCNKCNKCNVPETYLEMIDYKYKLASNKIPKITCSYCGKRKHWQRYLDQESGKVLPDRFGRCDNEVKCGEWIKPKYSELPTPDHQTHERSHNQRVLPSSRIKHTPQHYIPFDVFRLTVEGYDKNVFIQNLMFKIDFPFKWQDLKEVIALYHLGTIHTGNQMGATTIPFIDKDDNIQAIQVKQFDVENHTTSTDFLHSIIKRNLANKGHQLPEWLQLYEKNERKVGCLFGAHLLKAYPNNPVFLVEAPKTAVYGTLYFGSPENPQNPLWLAVYNKSSLTLKKCKALESRDVYLIPDLSKDGSTYELWSEKAEEFTAQLKSSHFQMSRLLENFASITERENGSDLADFLIRMDWRNFRNTFVESYKAEYL